MVYQCITFILPPPIQITPLVTLKRVQITPGVNLNAISSYPLRFQITPSKTVEGG